MRPKVEEELRRTRVSPMFKGDRGFHLTLFEFMLVGIVVLVFCLVFLFWFAGYKAKAEKAMAEASLHTILVACRATVMLGENEVLYTDEEYIEFTVAFADWQPMATIEKQGTMGRLLSKHLDKLRQNGYMKLTIDQNGKIDQIFYSPNARYTCVVYGSFLY